MTIAKSDEEILDSDCDDLTDEEYAYQQYLKEVHWLGYFEPYQITPPDIAPLLRKYNIISEEDENMIHYNSEDESKLKKVLEDDWDSLDEYERAVCHAYNKTLPRWRKAYPPTEEYMRSLREIINRHPKLT